MILELLIGSIVAWFAYKVGRLRGFALGLNYCAKMFPGIEFISAQRDRASLQ